MTISRTGRAPARNRAVLFRAALHPPHKGVGKKRLPVTISTNRRPSFFVQAHNPAASPARISGPRRFSGSAPEEEQDEGRQDEKGQRDIGKLGAPMKMKKGVPIRIMAARYPWFRSGGRPGRPQKAEDEEGEEKARSRRGPGCLHRPCSVQPRTMESGSSRG